VTIPSIRDCSGHIFFLPLNATTENKTAAIVTKTFSKLVFPSQNCISRNTYQLQHGRPSKEPVTSRKIET
jgi:hypothetical protein